MNTSGTMYVIQRDTDGYFHTTEPLLRWTDSITRATLYSTRAMADFARGRCTQPITASVKKVNLSLENFFGD